LKIGPVRFKLGPRHRPPDKALAGQAIGQGVQFLAAVGIEQKVGHGSANCCKALGRQVEVDGKSKNILPIKKTASALFYWACSY
jgi:hypothetical protein